MTGPEPDAAAEPATPPAEAAQLSIQEVSLALGVPAPTLRSWELRYGVPVVDRSQGGHRRYSPAQVAVLGRMRDLVATGLRPRQAAAQVRVVHDQGPERLVAAFVAAAQGLEPAGISEVLDAARDGLGLDHAVDDVLLPAMREIGLQWEHGHGDVGHEHLATHATQAWLARQPAGATDPRPGLGPVVLCCGPRDHHTVGLEALATLLRHRGWDCRMLGARTPGDTLARAVSTTGAAAVVLVCHLAAGRAAAVSALQARELAHAQLFYAGGAFTARQARHGVPGQYLGNHLQTAAEAITDALLWTPEPGARS